MNIIPDDDSMTFEREIHRGEIFYMTFKEQIGSEQQAAGLSSLFRTKLATSSRRQ